MKYEGSVQLWTSLRHEYRNLYVGNTTWKEEYEPIIRGERLYISFMTLAELLEACYRKGMSQSRIAKHLDEMKTRYVVIPWNEDICDRFARLRAERREKPISVPDALIAATALAYDLPLVTHNANDFLGVGGLNVITKYVPNNKGI